MDGSLSTEQEICSEVETEYRCGDDSGQETDASCAQGRTSNHSGNKGMGKIAIRPIEPQPTEFGIISPSQRVGYPSVKENRSHN
jgi:hypothetical protein